jgi:hypothetical protein
MKALMTLTTLQPQINFIFASPDNSGKRSVLGVMPLAGHPGLLPHPCLTFLPTCFLFNIYRKKSVSSYGMFEDTKQTKWDLIAFRRNHGFSAHFLSSEKKAIMCFFLPEQGMKSQLGREDWGCYIADSLEAEVTGRQFDMSSVCWGTFQ